MRFMWRWVYFHNVASHNVFIIEWFMTIGPVQCAHLTVFMLRTIWFRCARWRAGRHLISGEFCATWLHCFYYLLSPFAMLNLHWITSFCVFIYVIYYSWPLIFSRKAYFFRCSHFIQRTNDSDCSSPTRRSRLIYAFECNKLCKASIN